MNKKKVTIFIIILLLAAAAVFFLFYFTRTKSSNNEETVYVQSVSSLQNLGSMNCFSGIVETQESENADFDTSKKLNKTFVAEDDHVEKGDPLFSYDTVSVSLEIEQLQLEIDKLNTNITNYNDQIASLTTSLASAATDSARLEYNAQIAQNQADIAQAEFDIKTKEADMEKKKAEIDNAIVKAPISGKIAKVANIDDIIAGTNMDSSGNPSNAYIIIRADGDFRVKGTVSENNIFSIYQGQEMILVSRIDENITWTGTISTIDTSSTVNNNNTSFYTGGEKGSNYAFYVAPDDTTGLMIGQHVLIYDAAYKELGNGIWISSGFISDDNGEPFVFGINKEGEKLKKLPVKLGTYNAVLDLYLIESGLTSDDYIAWPDSNLKPGDATTCELSSIGFSDDSMLDTMED